MQQMVQPQPMAQLQEAHALLQEAHALLQVQQSQPQPPIELDAPFELAGAQTGVLVACTSQACTHAGERSLLHYYFLCTHRACWGLPKAAAMPRRLFRAQPSPIHPITLSTPLDAFVMRWPLACLAGATDHLPSRDEVMSETSIEKMLAHALAYHHAITSAAQRAQAQVASMTADFITLRNESMQIQHLCAEVECQAQAVLDAKAKLAGALEQLRRMQLVARARVEACEVALGRAAHVSPHTGQASDDSDQPAEGN